MNEPSPPRAGRREHHEETGLNIVISRVLVIGLIVSIVLLLVGVVLTVLRPGMAVQHEVSLKGLPRALAGLEPGAYFDLGLLVLLATPAARVAALLVAYTRRRLWFFSACSLIVLIVLGLSAFLGLRAG